MRHQEQVAEEQGHPHQQDDFPIVLPFLIAHVRPGDGVIFRQRNSLNLVHQLAAADAGFCLGGHFRGHELVETGYLPRPHHVRQGGYGAERHHLALIVLNVGVHDVIDGGAVLCRGLHLHLERVADQVEIIDVHGGQLALKRREDAADGHVHALSLFTVDVQEKLGGVRLIRAAGVHGSRQFVDFVQQVVGHSFQVFGSFLPAGLEHEGDAARQAQPHDGGRAEHGGLGRRNFITQDGSFLHDGIQGELRRLAFVPGVKLGDAHAQVFSVAAHEAESGSGGNLAHAGDAHQLLFRTAHGLFRTAQRGARGQLDITENGALVFRREEGFGYGLKQFPVADQDSGQQNQRKPRAAHHDAGAFDIAFARPFQRGVEGAEEAEPALFLLLPFQQQNAQRGAERQGIDCGKAEGHAHGYGELHVNVPHHAAEEGDGHVNGYRHQRGGDDGACNLVHALPGGFFRREILRLQNAHRIFHYDDAVVHQGPDYQNKAEHGQHIDGKAQGQQDGEGAYQGDGNGERRNERGTPVLQEQVRDAHHQNQGDDKRFHDFRHGGGNVLRGVIAHDVAHTFRKTFFQLLQRVFHAVHGFQGIGVIQAVHSHVHGVFPIVAAAARVGFRAQLNAGNVVQPGNVAILARADDNLAEFLHGLQSSGDVYLILDEVVFPFRADGAGRGLNVLRLDGVGNVIRRDIQGGHAQGVQPDAHAVILFRHQVDGRDSRYAGNLILHPGLDEVVQLQGTHAGGPEGEESQDVRGAFPDLDALVCHLLGKFVFHPFQGVLNVHHVDVRIRTALERQGQGIPAGVIRFGGEIEQVFQPVEFFLNGGSQRFHHHLGAGARIGSLHVDAGGRDFRILRNGELVQADAARQHHQDSDDDGEFGAFDKQVRNHG